MEFPLETVSSRIVLLAVCALVAVVFCYEAVRLELAEHRIWSNDLAMMQSAAALEPGYAEYWDRLGRFLQFGLDEQDFPSALRNYEKAVKISPLTAHYWIDLAIAHENLGDTARAREDFDEARKDYPDSAEVRWEYANFLLREGEAPEALKEMRAAVQEDSTLLPLAINRAWRATNDPDQVADAILPNTAAAYIEALNFFAGEEEVEAGLKIWRRLADSHQSFEIEKLFPFLDVAIQKNHGADAKRMWLEALVACGLPHDVPSNGSVVLNGGFEHDILNGGFDWRLPSTWGMTADYDTSIHHGGQRSLRLEFGGGMNLDLEQPLQFVAVDPARTYHFDGFIRTENITTESGARFYIFDPRHRDQIYLHTDDLTGSHDWTELQGDITTGADTQILQLEVRRLTSRMFENRLGGTAWIDDVSLVPATAAATPPATGAPQQGIQ
ncbi:MAG: tetratricopeptide repeat protein [Candidatus Acidiferrales bacterium]|jgi:tetratricopeptide (TPR) repeat protein